MKLNIYDLKGNKKGDMNIAIEKRKVREDLIQKILEIQKHKQPYAPSPVAGKQHSASGKLVHKRHVWKSQYGRGMSRIPRKAMSRRGSQFNWVGAIVPNTRGGRRAHPPKIISMINTKKINKKELKEAFLSALLATLSKEYIQKKYSKAKDKKINAPFVVDSSLSSLKLKQLEESLKKILGDMNYVLETKKRKRAGIGKSRGRKYKKSAGILIVIGNKEELKSKKYEITKVDKLGINDLAKGGVGRITLYTEKAIEDLNRKLKGEDKK